VRSPPIVDRPPVSVVGCRGRHVSPTPAGGTGEHRIGLHGTKVDDALRAIVRHDATQDDIRSVRSPGRTEHANRRAGTCLVGARAVPERLAVRTFLLPAANDRSGTPVNTRRLPHPGSPPSETIHALSRSNRDSPGGLVTKSYKSRPVLAISALLSSGALTIAI
jgi:hypothetical protein